MQFVGKLTLSNETDTCSQSFLTEAEFKANKKPIEIQFKQKWYKRSIWVAKRGARLLALVSNKRMIQCRP